MWAVPLDAATQVAAVLPDRVPNPPHTWHEVVELSNTEPVALSLSGPHAFLTFAAICASMGEPVGSSSEHLISTELAIEALDLVRQLALRSPRGSASLNPILMLERMRTKRDISYVPLTYGYVNYSSNALAFVDAPVFRVGGPSGSIIGGTGLALTRRCKPADDLIEHIAWLLSDETQRRFIPQHEGQPSRRSAWNEPNVDLDSHQFYSGTVKTMEGAMVRPRHDGFVAFQTKASAMIRSLIADRAVAAPGIERLQAAYRASFVVE